MLHQSPWCSILFSATPVQFCTGKPLLFLCLLVLCLGCRTNPILHFNSHHALAHTTGVTNYSPPTFNNTIKAFDLVHHLGMEPSCQTICTLDQVISTTSTNLDQPKASPSSLKCPCLVEHISMDVEEDTVSLGDDEEQPFIYEDFCQDHVQLRSLVRSKDRLVQKYSCFTDPAWTLCTIPSPGLASRTYHLLSPYLTLDTFPY